MTHALRIPTEAEWKELETTAKVSAPRAEDYAGWEDRLRAWSKILLAEMRDQRRQTEQRLATATARAGCLSFRIHTHTTEASTFSRPMMSAATPERRCKAA